MTSISNIIFKLENNITIEVKLKNNFSADHFNQEEKVLLELILKYLFIYFTYNEENENGNET